MRFIHYLSKFGKLIQIPLPSIDLLQCKCLFPRIKTSADIVIGLQKQPEHHLADAVPERVVRGTIQSEEMARMYVIHVLHRVKVVTQFYGYSLIKL